MNTVTATTRNGSEATFYIDVEGDIFESREEAEIMGIEGKIIVDGFYVGSFDEMKRSALAKYNDRMAGCR